MASQNLNVGSAANANDGDTLRAAFIKVRKMFAEVYGQTYVDDTSEIPSVTFEIKEDKLKATNAAVDGYVLTYDSGTGGFTWEQKFDGDITSIVAGAGLTGDATSGDASLAVGAGDGITVNANDVALDSSVAGSGLTYTSGVLSVDAIDTDGIAADAVDGTKLEQFDDTLTAATSGDILVSNGTDFIHATMSGDATIASGGALTIGNDKITHAKLGDRFTASSAVIAAADTEIDFDDASIYTITSSIAVDLRFENEQIGDVKTIIITDSGGTSSLTFDTGTNTVTTLNGTYDATSGAVNFIQVVCTASNTFFVTISQ